MKTKINSATTRTIQFHADAATKTFYSALRDHKLRSTRCRACGHVPYPPRDHCTRCNGVEIDWIDLPTRGTVYAFSQQQKSWRFSRPDVLALVALPGVDGLVLTKIDAPFDSLAIGVAVEVDFLDVGPELTVHQFRRV